LDNQKIKLRLLNQLLLIADLLRGE